MLDRVLRLRNKIMIKPTRAILIALLPAVILGCELKDEEPEGILPKGYTDALDKAEGVEDLLKDTQKKRQEEMDEAMP
jgi:hypothetical protein